MVTGDDNERIGAGRKLAAGVLSFGVLLYIGHTVIETSRWARDLLLRVIEFAGLTEVAATTISISDIISGAIAALMTAALLHLYGHHVLEGIRPIVTSALQAIDRNRRFYATLTTSLLIIATPLAVGHFLYDAARPSDRTSDQSSPPASQVAAGAPSIPTLAFDSRWVVVGRSLNIGPIEFVEVTETATPFAKQVASNPCAMNEEFTSEELSACVDDLRKHPPRTGIGGPRRWFIHKVNGRFVFDQVVGSAPLPRARPQLPLDLSPQSE